MPINNATLADIHGRGYAEIVEDADQIQDCRGFFRCGTEDYLNLAEKKRNGEPVTFTGPVETSGQTEKGALEVYIWELELSSNTTSAVFTRARGNSRI